MSTTIALVFPGQGSQSVGMGRALYDAFPHIRALYEEADHILGYANTSLCFEGPAERLNLTEYTQPALLVSSIAAFRALDLSREAIAAVAGHSLGEYSALVAAEGLTYADAVSLVRKRGQYMADAVPPGSGLVAAILGLSREDVEAVCQEAQAVGVVSTANVNCPGQIVIAGERAAVDRALEYAKRRGSRKAIPLPVSVPVHTSLMQNAAHQLARDVERVKLSDLHVPLINNAEARAIRLANQVQNSLIQQLPSPVLWEESILVMWEMGIRTFIEVGPGKVLTGLIKRIVPEARVLNVQDPVSLDATRRELSL